MDHNGNFVVEVPKLPPTAQGFLNAAHLIDSPQIPGAPKLPPLPSIIYRSAPFKLTAANEHPLRIFVAHHPLTKEQGISQDDVNKETSNRKGDLSQLQTLTAFITDTRVHVVATALNNNLTMTFDLNVLPETGPNLDDFIDHQLENFDVDWPGPDFIAKMCVSEDDFHDRVDKSVGSLLDNFNPRIKDEIVKAIATATGQDPKIVGALFDEQVSMTFESIKQPVIRTVDVGFQNRKINIRALVPDPWFGTPRKLFG